MPERPGKADGGWRGCGIPIGYGRFGGYTWWVKSTCGSTRLAPKEARSSKNRTVNWVAYNSSAAIGLYTAVLGTVAASTRK